jgi:hypothetical protein
MIRELTSRRYIPKLRISKDRILVAAGPKLVGYSLRPPPSSLDEIRQKTVTSETIVWTPDIPSLKQRSIHQNDLTALRRRNVHVTAARRGTAYSPLEDITGFYECPDGQVVTGNVGGVLQRQRFTLDPYTNGTAQVAQSTAIYQVPGVQQIVEVSGATSGSSTLVLSATKDGQASLFRADAPWLPSSTVNTQTRLWTAHLSPSAAYAAFGGSGGPAQAIRIYPVAPTGILTPTQTHPSFLGTTHTRSAVYGLASPPADTSMPYTNNPSALLLSAWYDSFARVYDLRTSFGNGKRPVMEMQDPWSHEALYCCDFVGDGQIVAGAARHGMIHLWDPRMIRPRQQGRPVARETDGVTGSDSQESAVFAPHRGGWTAYTPGGSDSPVYDVKAEGGRIWGVTNKRAFVLAFDTSGPSAQSPGARGWDIVPPYMAPRVSNGWSGRGGKQDEGARDYATCYEHGDRTLRPFYSLGAEAEGIGLKGNGRKR